MSKLMVTRELVFPVTVYYDDTDLTGVVYHANYLKYFERARSEFLGADRLLALQREQGIAVFVYKLEMHFKEGAVLGDQLEIRSQPELQGNYRIVIKQRALRAKDGATLVDATIELVFVANRVPVAVPDWIADMVRALA